MQLIEGNLSSFILLVSLNKLCSLLLKDNFGVCISLCSMIFEFEEGKEIFNSYIYRY